VNKVAISTDMGIAKGATRGPKGAEPPFSPVKVEKKDNKF